MCARPAGWLGLPAGSSEVPPKFFSGVVDGPDFCTNLNLGWPLLHASDSDGDGVADVCSLPSTRREAAVRQQALEALAAELPHEFQAWLARVCWSVLVSADFGDREADLAGDACAPGVIGVPDVPGVPGGLSVVSRDGYLEVAWSAPADDGGLAIAGYELRYRQADGDSWASHPSIGSGTNTVITGLAAGTSYEVQVRAVNPAGTSKWSPSATGTTGAPPSAISGLEVVGGDQRLSITWEPPADDGGLTITSYELRYRQADGGSWSSHPHPGSDTDAVVYRLATGVSYEVQVRAVNPAGAGGWSLSAFGATGAAPGVLGRPEVVGSYRRLSITWEPPADDGGLEVTGYELRYRRAGGGSWTTHPHRGLGTSWEITRLPNGLIYEVQVRAVNPAGPGEWSPSGSGAAESPPGAMDEPRVLGGYRLLRVWWTPPADDGGFAVTGYQVRYRDSADGSWTVHSHDSLATDTTIDGLEDETIYKVQVRATNSAGYGRWSPTATVATAGLPPGLPATPGALTLARGVEKIDASWTAPDSNRSPITDYDVRYRACTGTGNNPCATAGNYHYLDDAEENAENTATTATITGLTNGTTYQVQVRATNDIGDSEWSKPSAAKPADKPSQPVAPILHAGASEQITVYWWTPEDNGEPISSYTVQYRQGTSGDWTDVPVSASSSSASAMATQTTFGAASSTTVQETTISNLTNDTTYQVRVGGQQRRWPRRLFDGNGADCKCNCPHGAWETDRPSGDTKGAPDADVGLHGTDRRRRINGYRLRVQGRFPLVQIGTRQSDIEPVMANRAVKYTCLCWYGWKRCKSLGIPRGRVSQQSSNICKPQQFNKLLSKCFGSKPGWLQQLVDWGLGTTRDAAADKSCADCIPGRRAGNVDGAHWVIQRIRGAVPGLHRNPDDLRDQPHLG